MAELAARKSAFPDCPDFSTGDTSGRQGQPGSTGGATHSANGWTGIPRPRQCRCLQTEEGEGDTKKTPTTVQSCPDVACIRGCGFLMKFVGHIGQ